jgi:exodeoxyribonuclease VII large subunit
MPDLFSGSPDAAPWTPTLLARTMRRVLEGGIGRVWLRAEISGLKVYRSGHWYFTLRDAEAQLRAVMWRTYASRQGEPPADGTQVFVFGTPTLWEEKGELRFTVLELLPGERLGPQQLALDRVRKALERDGLFDPARKRPLPPLPERIAVVTSLDGAALHDMITVTRNRWPAVELVVIGSRVQGAEAEHELARALERVNRLPRIDICIVGRGGGSREDLATFNSELVCRALAAVRVPTISAVGHETDVTFTDLVADHRAATPSAAMELAVPDREEILARVSSLGLRLGQALGRGTRLARERLARAGDRLEVALGRRLERPRRDLERLGAQLDALSPLRVLDRGYAVARDGEGRVLRRRADFVAGDPFRLTVSDGVVAARTEGTA